MFLLWVLGCSSVVGGNFSVEGAQKELDLVGDGGFEEFRRDRYLGVPSRRA